MSLILILSYRLKEVTNSNVLHCLEIQRFAHISGTRYRIVIGLPLNNMPSIVLFDDPLNLVSI